MAKALGPALQKLAKGWADGINNLDRASYIEMSVKNQVRTILIAKDLREMGYNIQELPPEREIKND